MFLKRKSGMIAFGLLLAAMAVSGCKQKTADEKEPSADMTVSHSEISEENTETKETQMPADPQESQVKLGEYKGIAVTLSILPDITDEDVENSIQTIVSEAAVSSENTSRAVAAGDTVNVDYTGYIDGEEIADSAVTDYNMLIGSGVFFNGAENQLIGVMPGNTAEITVTFPEGYPQAELVGKQAVYKITVNYIQEVERGELTDEFVAKISDCRTVDEFRAVMKENMIAGRENERKLMRQQTVWQQVLANAQVLHYNANDVEAIVSEYRSYDEAAAKDFDMSLEDYVLQYQGMAIETYNSELERLAQMQILEKLAVTAIAEAENINADDPTEDEISRCAQMQEYDTVDGYKSGRGEEGIKEDVLTLRVQDFVVANANITEQ